GPSRLLERYQELRNIVIEELERDGASLSSQEFRIILRVFDQAVQEEVRELEESRVARIEKSERSFHAVLSATPDLVFVCDTASRIKFANEACLHVLDKSWQQIAGHPFSDAANAESLKDWVKEASARIDEVLRTNQPTQWKSSISGVNGERNYEATLNP